MYATNISNIHNMERKLKVDLQADTVPSTLPATGADVENLADDVTFDVGSTLLVVPTADVYAMGSDGNWHKVGESA